MTVTIDPLTVTVAEAAGAIKVSTWTIYKLIREEKLARVPHLHQCRIAVDELKRFVNERSGS
jgi:predicted DNA-binding transcriptional regulator YafY